VEAHWSRQTAPTADKTHWLALPGTAGSPIIGWLEVEVSPDSRLQSPESRVQTWTLESECMFTVDSCISFKVIYMKLNQ
jgi:hypothetical protein